MQFLSQIGVFAYYIVDPYKEKGGLLKEEKVTEIHMKVKSN